jgi:hypothetical protein
VIRRVRLCSHGLINFPKLCPRAAGVTSLSSFIFRIESPDLPIWKMFELEIWSHAAERVRVNVTRTLKLALTRIGRVYTELENHLVRSIGTGAFCRYQPDPDESVSWCI